MVIRTLTRTELSSLGAALAALGDSQANSLSGIMILGCKTWRAWPPGDLVWLLRSSGQDPTEGGKTAHAKAVSFVADNRLGATSLDDLGYDEIATLIAPTVLDALWLAVPQAMQGRSLLGGT